MRENCSPFGNPWHKSLRFFLHHLCTNTNVSSSSSTILAPYFQNDLCTTRFQQAVTCSIRAALHSHVVSANHTHTKIYKNLPHTIPHICFVPRPDVRLLRCRRRETFPGRGVGNSLVLGVVFGFLPKSDSKKRWQIADLAIAFLAKSRFQNTDRRFQNKVYSC